MHVKVVNGEIVKFPYRMDDLRKGNPNTSFPRGYEHNAELLANYDVYPVTVLSQPSFNEKTHDIARDDIPTLVNDVWQIGWYQVPKSTEAISTRAKANSDYARAERDRFLRESDWTQLPDSPADRPAWVAYRQELRNVTGQPGWPDDVIWPTPPT